MKFSIEGLHINSNCA